MIAAARSAVRPLFSDRPLGFDPRWLVRHAARCESTVHRLTTPRYIGGWTQAGTDAEHARCPTPTVRPPAFSLGQYRALRRRLERWELDHLRQHAAEVAEELECERRARERADDAAEFWCEQALNLELREGECLGLAVDGTLHVVAASEKGGAA